MSVLTSLARAEASAAGRALPLTTLRHAHLSDRPLLIVAAQLAGEACAPVAAMAGDDRDKPRLLVVGEPRNRTQRFEFAADLAEVVLGYLDRYVTEPGQPAGDAGEDSLETYPDAPQLLVPNQPTVEFLRLLGRSTRFRQTEGEYAVPAPVPLLGRWLSYYAERAESPRSALLLPLTEVLAGHWATGQSAVEDAHLGALLGWIDPPPGLTGAQAARAAEDPAVCPPAGPVTDPEFDNQVLRPALEELREATAAGDSATTGRAKSTLEAALRAQLEPTWEQAWRATDLLRSLPAGASVDRRWQDDRESFTRQVARIADGGGLQARRDGAVAAAIRLARLEREQQRLACERAYDDPLVMAEYRMTGEAIAGTVVATDPARMTDGGKRLVLRPTVVVATQDPVLFAERELLRSPARPRQDVKVLDVDYQDGQALVTLEIQSGMGRGKAAPPGSIPDVGDPVTYTSLRDEYRRSAAFPAREDTPWTHGGPPEEYVPTEDDAREDWT